MHFYKYLKMQGFDVLYQSLCMIKERDYVVVCTADENRGGGEAGRADKKTGSGTFIWGMFCSVPGTALEKAEAESCSCKAGVSRICIYHFKRAGGFIFLSEKGSGYGEADGGQ